jgi:hypothetical protein
MSWLSFFKVPVFAFVLVVGLTAFSADGIAGEGASDGMNYLAAVEKASSKQSDSVGIVLSVKGKVIVISKTGKVKPAKTRMALRNGDRIETKKHSYIQVNFIDGSTTRLGSNSDMTIQKYVFNEETGEAESKVKIDNGAMAFLAGKIAKVAPENYKISTTTATIGIRGSGGEIVTSDGSLTDVGTRVKTMEGHVLEVETDFGMFVVADPNIGLDVSGGGVEEIPVDPDSSWLDEAGEGGEEDDEEADSEEEEEEATEEEAEEEAEEEEAEEGDDEEATEEEAEEEATEEEATEEEATEEEATEEATEETATEEEATEEVATEEEVVTEEEPVVESEEAVGAAPVEEEPAPAPVVEEKIEPPPALVVIGPDMLKEVLSGETTVAGVVDEPEVESSDYIGRMAGFGSLSGAHKAYGSIVEGDNLDIDQLVLITPENPNLHFTSRDIDLSTATTIRKIRKGDGFISDVDETFFIVNKEGADTSFEVAYFGIRTPTSHLPSNGIKFYGTDLVDVVKKAIPPSEQLYGSIVAREGGILDVGVGTEILVDYTNNKVAGRVDDNVDTPVSMFYGTLDKGTGSVKNLYLYTLLDYSSLSSTNVRRDLLSDYSGGGGIFGSNGVGVGLYADSSYTEGHFVAAGIEYESNPGITSKDGGYTGYAQGMRVMSSNKSVYRSAYASGGISMIADFGDNTFSGSMTVEGHALKMGGSLPNIAYDRDTLFGEIVSSTLPFEPHTSFLATLDVPQLTVNPDTGTSVIPADVMWGGWNAVVNKGGGTPDVFPGLNSYWVAAKPVSGNIPTNSGAKIYKTSIRSTVLYDNALPGVAEGALRGGGYFVYDGEHGTVKGISIIGDSYVVPMRGSVTNSSTGAYSADEWGVVSLFGDNNSALMKPSMSDEGFVNGRLAGSNGAMMIQEFNTTNNTTEVAYGVGIGARMIGGVSLDRLDLSGSMKGVRMGSTDEVYSSSTRVNFATDMHMGMSWDSFFKADGKGFASLGDEIDFELLSEQGVTMGDGGEFATIYTQIATNPNFVAETEDEINVVNAVTYALRRLAQSHDADDYKPVFVTENGRSAIQVDVQASNISEDNQVREIVSYGNFGTLDDLDRFSFTYKTDAPIHPRISLVLSNDAGTQTVTLRSAPSPEEDFTAPTGDWQTFEVTPTSGLTWGLNVNTGSYIEGGDTYTLDDWLSDEDFTDLEAMNITAISLSFNAFDDSPEDEEDYTAYIDKIEMEMEGDNDPAEDWAKEAALNDNDSLYISKEAFYIPDAVDFMPLSSLESKYTPNDATAFMVALPGLEQFEHVTWGIWGTSVENSSGPDDSLFGYFAFGNDEVRARINDRDFYVDYINELRRLGISSPEILTYTGKSMGSVFGPDRTGAIQVGSASLTVNFASNGVGGLINLGQDEIKLNVGTIDALNSLLKDALIYSGQTQMNGASFNGGQYGVSFFGKINFKDIEGLSDDAKISKIREAIQDFAREGAGTFNASDGAHHAIGTFGVKRD